MKSDDLKKLRELLGKFSTAMMVTRTGDDLLKARPMALAQVDDAGTVWFITGHDSAKLHEVEHDNRVHLVFQNEHTLYLSVSGVGRVVQDPGKVAEVWQEPFKVWFPHGKDDANIALMAVEPHDAEYWDSQGWNRISYLFRVAKAYATGEPPKVEEGKEHGVLMA